MNQSLLTWQWLGGFFEGEGCVTWYAGSKNSTAGRGAVITIGQKEKKPLEMIQAFLVGRGFLGARLYWRKPYPSKWRGTITGCWVLQITRKQENQLFLEAILPYLIAKADKVKLVLKNVESQRSAHFLSTDIKRILKQWDAGKSGKEIAEVLKVDVRRVMRILKLNGKHTGRPSTRFMRQCIAV